MGMNIIDEIKLFYTQQFPTCLSNFKDCSYDNANGTFLVNSLNNCVNYDDVKNKLMKNDLCSCDSLFFENNKLYFIEFKNCELKRVIDNLIFTFKDTYIINYFLLNTYNSDLLKCNKTAVIVCDEMKNSRIIAAYKASKLSGNNCSYPKVIRKILNSIKLKKYLNKDVLFDDVLFLTQHEFDDLIKNNLLP